MPNTLIRDGYLDSDRVSALSDFDDRVFFRLLLAADDAGRADGRVDKLRSALFPTRERVRSADVQEALTRLEKADLICRWSHGGKHVVQILRWQRRSGAKYSKFPGPCGKFEILWVDRQTRDGVTSFSSTSLITHADGSSMGSDPPCVEPAYTETETETETKTKTEAQTKTVCSEPQAASEPKPPPPGSPVEFPFFPVVAGEPWPFTAIDVARLGAAFVGVDVPQEGRKAHAWLLANPTKRKTARGMPKFLFGWMERCQNRGGHSPSLSAKPDPLDQAERVSAMLRNER